MPDESSFFGAWRLPAGNLLFGCFGGNLLNVQIAGLADSTRQRGVAVSATFGQIADCGDGTARRWFDCDTAIWNLALSQRGSAERRTRKSTPGGCDVPILFSPWEKPELSDSLLVCFGALSLSQATRTQIDTGILVYGDNLRRRTVQISDHAAQLNRTLREIGSLLPGGRDPPLVLNAHCPVCDFWSRCRGVAIERDDLSLLSGMNPKDRSKAINKGILTISQLSYGYRPRRRKRTKPDAERAARSTDATHVRPPARHDNKLKALAIKKGRIHVVGAPAIKLEGVPTFIDVEGMPDRDSYYLIGLRFESDGVPVERAFWADGPKVERGMWENCLRTLKSIENAQLVHYGANETRFLRTMKKRYVLEPEDVEFVDRLITSSINLVACIYGSVYFPTYSNSLKEVARHLGYGWAWPHTSGAAAVLLRKTWELSACGDIKKLLLAYNMDDCRAAAVVADALTRISTGGTSAPESVDIGTLEVGFQRTFGKFDSALPEFAKINDAAYWNYQRSKVFVRTDKSVQRTVRKSERHRNISGVEKEITIYDAPAKCPKCSATKLWSYPSEKIERRL
jgi:predicted RecB family nuclease